MCQQIPIYETSTSLEANHFWQLSNFGLKTHHSAIHLPRMVWKLNLWSIWLNFWCMLSHGDLPTWCYQSAWNS